MPISKGTTDIGAVFKGTTEIASVYKGTTLVYENYKTLTADGVPPLTLEKCKNTNMLGYKVYGNSKQQLLPDGYTQLEYIESTGTQYINTGINPDRTSRFELDFIQTTHNTSIMGAYSNTNNRVQAFRGGVSGNDSSYFEFRVFCNTEHKDYDSNILYPSGVKLNVVFDIKNLKGTVNGDVVNLTDMGGGNISYPVWLFCANNAGNVATISNSKLYSYAHYKNDILIQKLVPCKNSSNVIGMYDIVNGVFYQNAGTGTFTAGPVAPTPDAPIEIQSVGDIKNIWNSTLIAGCMKFADGQYLNYPGYVCNATPIPVKAGETYTLSADNYTDPESTSTGFVFYNNGTFVSSLITTSLTVTIPAGVNQLYYDFRKQSSPSQTPTDITNVQLEVGSTATAYEPYGYKIPITVAGKNLFDKSTITKGYYMGISDPVAAEWGAYSDYIEIKQSTAYYFTDVIPAAAVSAVRWYDINKTYISSSFFTSSSQTTANGTATSPSNAYYCIVNIWNGQEDYTQVEEGDTATAYEPYYAPRTTNIYLNQPLRKIGNADAVKLPSGYTQLEYIQSTGTQYIDTGIIPAVNQQVICKFSNLKDINKNSENYVFGHYPYLGGYAKAVRAGAFTGPNYNPYRYSQCEYFDTNGNIISTEIAESDTIIVKTNNPLTLDTNPLASYHIFAQGRKVNNVTTVMAYSKVRLHYFKIIDTTTNEIISNFIPCKNLDNTIGLYDTVTNTFYTNAGTGTFTAGPEIYVDYIDFETQKVYRNIGHIDLSDTTYTYQSQYTRFRSNTIPGLKIITGNWTYDLMSDIYGTTLAQNFNIGAQGGSLFVWDNRYTDPTALKTALAGHYLDFALGATTEESITLPSILLNKGTNVVSVGTSLNTSNMWIKYKGKQ